LASGRSASPFAATLSITDYVISGTRAILIRVIVHLRDNFLIAPSFAVIRIKEGNLIFLSLLGRIVGNYVFAIISAR
jgi:hypothetical protein